MIPITAADVGQVSLGNVTRILNAYPIVFAATACWFRASRRSVFQLVGLARPVGVGKSASSAGTFKEVHMGTINVGQEILTPIEVHHEGHDSVLPVVMLTDWLDGRSGEGRLPSPRGEPEHLATTLKGPALTPALRARMQERAEATRTR